MDMRDIIIIDSTRHGVGKQPNELDIVAFFP